MPPNAPIHHESYDQWGVITLDQNIPEIAKAIFVGTAGTVIAVDRLGNTATFTAPQGLLFIAPAKILTGSGAAGLIWLA